MKKYLAPALALALLVSATGASQVFADAYTYHISQQDSGNSPTTTDATPSAYMTSFLANDVTNGVPAFYYTDGIQFVFDDTNHNVSIGHIVTDQVTGLNDYMAGVNTRLDGDDTSFSTLNSSLTSLTTTVSSNTSAISTANGNITTVSDSLNLFKAGLASTTREKVYYNDVATTSSKHLLYNGTTTSGTTIFYLTADGTSSGAALCPNTIAQVNVIANDPNNTFGLGWALTNSNKTLTITANARSFTATTILGISVLGSSTLAAAANGTAIMASVDCN